MTRIFTEGAEMGDVLFWNTHSGATISSEYKSGGVYSYVVANWAVKYFTPPVSEFYFRVNMKVPSTDNGQFIVFRSDSTNIIGFGRAGTFKSTAYVGNALVATGSIVLPSDIFHLIEVYGKIADSEGRISIKINGVLDIDYTGDTKPSTETTVNNFYVDDLGFGFGVGIDDLALNDTNGTVDNSWCGKGYIVKITPSGSGTTNSWLNSGSVSGSANYLYVDEYAYDGDTTYVYVSGSNTGYQDQYAMSAFTSGGGVIKRIFSECRAKKSTADFDDYIKLGYLPEGGVDQVSGSSILTTSYSQIIGTSASANPVTGLAWTDSDINALEFVCEI